MKRVNLSNMLVVSRPMLGRLLGTVLQALRKRLKSESDLPGFTDRGGAGEGIQG